MNKETDQNFGLKYQGIRNVLLIEDDLTATEMVRIIFAKMQNNSTTDTAQYYGLWEINNGKSAVQTLRETPFDLILLDISLPIMSGFEVLVFVRAMHIYTPIFMFSSSNDILDVHKAYDLGANGFILKSEGRRQIELRIRAVCDCYFNYLLLPCPLY